MDTIAAPSLERYRTAHKIEAVPHDGRWYCAVDDVPVYRVVTQRWQHDMNVVRRLILADVPPPLRQFVTTIEPCFLCHQTRMVELGCFSRVTLGTGVVNLCDNCREKGDER